MRKTLTAAIVVAVLLILAAVVLILAVRGGEDDGHTSAGHNDADVTFAQQMILHHQQAVEMSELAGTRAESQKVKDLAADIEAAQGPEVKTMTGWLGSWGEDVPDEGMPGMDHGDMSSDDMTGMMSEEDMAELENASGAEFDQMFLTMMIEHHEGAIEMAQTEQAEGEFPDAKATAKDIETAQTEEIKTMQALLKS
ncbi:DUF305 domain-containing protein [Nocardioides panzhihuensis]|uniref:Uncharacterized protein (DUF305 family) n=1 Tax=Nocardioides panzhihuensis TaxID=860243 RepID=A0A7Z0DKL8_9ACTN|nr:DUF305 domain-containing protein [Nocardioides panzhihuensis]NYI77049.1 uncharacterized protein (DUF305 family) [Nocardioides panzhihuensis]